MNWAWTVTLTPAPKLVLMALADIADDRGICWPGLRSLARKTCLAERSVQRLLRSLQAQALLSVEPRFGANGSRTSNCYRLAIGRHPPDKLSGGAPDAEDLVTAGTPPGDIAITTPVTTVSPLGDHHVGGTTTEPSLEPSIESPQLQPESKTPTGERSAAVDPHRVAELAFPKTLNGEQQRVIRSMLEQLEPERAQDIVDELAGRMATGQVRHPSRYCAALLKRAREGRFHLELGVSVRATRASQVPILDHGNVPRSHASTQSNAQSPNLQERIASLRIRAQRR